MIGAGKLKLELQTLPFLKFFWLFGGNSSGRVLPDLFLPSTHSLDQVESDLGMCRITFQPNNNGRDRNFVFRIFGDRKIDLCTDRGELSRQVDECAVLPDVFGLAFFDDRLACIVFPFHSDGERDRMSGTSAAVLHTGNPLELAVFELSES